MRVELNWNEHERNLKVSHSTWKFLQVNHPLQEFRKFLQVNLSVSTWELKSWHFRTEIQGITSIGKWELAVLVTNLLRIEAKDTYI